jgi:hypothetical protein
LENDPLSPYASLVGSWKGSGQGPQGPFHVRAEFTVRRWILLTHHIAPPGIEQPFYVSTQVFGYDANGLTLDYFDTAGSFHFSGEETGDGLGFSWKNGDLWKKSTYSLDGADRVRFQYQSFEHAPGSADQLLDFAGEMTRA